MKTIFICPADRPGVAQLAEVAPLAISPLLGKSVLEYWLEHVAAQGTKEVLVLASDRPHEVRAVLGDGTRWGLRADLLAQARELTVEEARVKYGGEGDQILVLDCLPGPTQPPLFETHAGWFEAVRAFLPNAITPVRIGAREVQPGVWVGLHAQINPTATLHAPCWVGEHALIGAHATIGPGAIIEDRAIVEDGAHINQSIVGPETFVGQHILVQNSLAHGSTLINWMTDSSVTVPDAFFLCALNDRRFSTPTSSLAGRALALAAMIVTAPIAIAIMLLSLLRGETPLVLRLGVRPQRNVRSAGLQTFAYYDLACGNNWLRRWPQFWSVVRGDLTWVGNRPLRPTEALALANDFERLWLTAPVGLVALGDIHGCRGELTNEACAHASFYAVNAGPRLDWFVLSRAFLLAAFAWPIRWTRRKDAGVPLPSLAPKQEI